MIFEQLMRKIRLMIGTGVVKLIDDAKQIQSMQVTALSDEVRNNVNRMQDYGLTSVPHEGAEALLACVGGARHHMVVVRCDDGRYRKKNLQPGEVALYTDEGDYLLLKRGRIVEVVAGTKLKATAPQVEIIASSQVTITSPTVSMSGNLNVTGIITGGTVKQGSIVLGTHTHTGVTGGSSSTGAPQ